MKNERIGLTDIYNEMKEGAYEILNKLHLELDKEIGKSYGFNNKNIRNRGEILLFLRELNESRYKELNIAKLMKLKSQVRKAKSKTQKNSETKKAQ